MEDSSSEKHIPAKIIQVGSRKSQLALIQTQTVIDKLKEFYSNNPDDLEEANLPLEFNVVPMSTVGDEVLNKPLVAIGSKSLFTRELEVALLENRTDFVVHSLKDLPTTLPQGCTIGAILKRDNPEDVIILKKSLRNTTNPLSLLCKPPDQDETITIGTSAQRRIAMIKRINPAINCIDIRGNLNTRLSKLDNDESPYSAIILAKAGVDRMDWSNLGAVILDENSSESLKTWCYAVGQGALAVECRLNDAKTLNLLSRIVDLKTTYEVIAERSMMKKLDGGCSVPLGVRSSWSTEEEQPVLTLVGMVLSVDGTKSVMAKESVKLESFTQSHINEKMKHVTLDTGMSLVLPDMENSNVQQNAINSSKLGLRVAQKLIDKGCLVMIESCRIKSG